MTYKKPRFKPQLIVLSYSKIRYTKNRADIHCPDSNNIRMKQMLFHNA